jgi:hypothetical protein
VVTHHSTNLAIHCLTRAEPHLHLRSITLTPLRLRSATRHHNFSSSQRSSTEIFYQISKLSSSQALLRIMKLSAEEKARRKEERAELKAKQARELHDFDNVALADREKELKGVRHYAPLSDSSVSSRIILAPF